jgi:sulfur-carrier protein adenylyltransferase/sulfurtransferase
MRSKAAAGLLSSAGFTNILNMSGGIIAYDGGKAIGSEAFGMDHFLGQEFSDTFRMSYAMEEGLRQLYIALQECTDDPQTIEMLARFARYEDGHKAKLLASFPGTEDEELQDVSTLEGGFDKQQFLDHYRKHLPEKRDLIELGMMLETQALDLYSRLSRETKEMQSRKLFAFLASEEKMHLQVLSRELDAL